MKIEAVLWVALASSFAWASSPVEEQSPVQVSVSFSLAAPVVTLREPVLVRCRIRNGLSQTVLVDFGDSIESAFSFRIVDPSERSWDISPPLSSGIAPVPRWQLSPGESRSEELLLDKWYRFDQPGSYEIEPAVAVAVTTTSSEVIPRTATRRSTSLSGRGTRKSCVDAVSPWCGRRCRRMQRGYSRPVRF